MFDFIPLSVPVFKGNEWKYVKDCLDTGWVSSAGKFVDLFESMISDYTGSGYAIACINGTSALHISLILSGVKKDDEVIVPTLTFIAPVNAVKYCGAYPIFLDSDNFFNINVQNLIDFLETKTVYRKGFSYNVKTKRRISAIIPVHIFGNAVNMENLTYICKSRNIKIIEDATESLGTRYTTGKFSGMHTGTIGDFGCISFNGNKIITTGGGGIILTNNKKLANKARYLTTQAKDDSIRYIHKNIGYNYRLTNIQSALGVAQLEQLDSFIAKKKYNYYLYKKEINKINGLILADVPPYAESNYWMYPLIINKEVFGLDRDSLMKLFNENKIQTRPLWELNHRQRPYRDCEKYIIRNSVKLHKNTLNIPSSSNLKSKDIKRIIDVLKNGK